MFHTHPKIEITREEVTVIEAALATQAKILGVQADAGGSGARRRLNEVKKVLARLEHQAAPADRKARRGWLGRFSLAGSAG